MSETAVMTLRLPKGVRRNVERLAARFGHKPAQLGARLIEEGLRRRDFPQVDLRETAAGRVAYIGGTRFAVYWVAGIVPGTMSAEDFARQNELPVERVRAALAYARAFADEIANDRAHAEANRKWIEQQDTAARSARPAYAVYKGKGWMPGHRAYSTVRRPWAVKREKKGSVGKRPGVVGKGAGKAAR